MTRAHVAAILAAIEETIRPWGESYSVRVKTIGGTCYHGDPWRPGDGVLRLSRIDGVENTDTFIALDQIESIQIGNIY